MPKLISQKNLRKPPSSGYVLSSSTTGVRSWVDNRSVGVNSNGTTVGTASTVNFSSNNVSATVSAGIATITISDPTSSVFSIIGL